MAKTIPNFGQIAMASRQGWKWASELRLFVRITVAPGAHRVEIQPPTFIPDTVPPMRQVHAWGEWQVQEGVLSLIPALNKYMGRQQPYVFFIDDDGLEIPEGKLVSAPIKGGTYAPGQRFQLIDGEMRPVDEPVKPEEAPAPTAVISKDPPVETKVDKDPVSENAATT
jgi:hypothetical protein